MKSHRLPSQPALTWHSVETQRTIKEILKGFFTLVPFNLRSAVPACLEIKKKKGKQDGKKLTKKKKTLRFFLKGLKTKYFFFYKVQNILNTLPFSIFSSSFFHWLNKIESFFPSSSHYCYLFPCLTFLSSFWMMQLGQVLLVLWNK